MKLNSKLIDALFIVLSAITLLLLSEYGILTKYSSLALIPILIAYFIGKQVEKKFNN